MRQQREEKGDEESSSATGRRMSRCSSDAMRRRIKKRISPRKGRWRAAVREGGGETRRSREVRRKTMKGSDEEDDEMELQFEDRGAVVRKGREEEQQR